MDRFKILHFNLDTIINIINSYIDKMNSNNFFQFVDHVFYINLDHRVDRRKTVEKELKKIDPKLKNVTRFSAIDGEKMKISPQKGCAMSHMECVKIAKEKKYKNVLICEDDFYFNQPIDKILQHLKDFFDYINNDYYFFLLGTYQNFSYKKIHKNISKVYHSFSCTSYIINSLIYDDWIKTCKENLLKNFVAVDGLWLKYQKENGKTYTCNTDKYRLVKQHDGYSDLAKKHRKITW